MTAESDLAALLRVLNFKEGFYVSTRSAGQGEGRVTIDGTAYVDEADLEVFERLVIDEETP